MGKIELINPLVEPQWDRFVESHPFSTIHHLSAWKEFLEKVFKHMRGYYFVLFEDSTRTIKAGLPVFYVQSRITGNRLVSIPFATLCDPLVSTRDDMAQLFESVLKLSKKFKTAYIEIRTHKMAFQINNELLKKSSHYISHYFNLNDSLSDLRKTFLRRTRQPLNRTKRYNFELKEATNELDLAIFYQLYQTTRKRNGLPSHPFVFFKALWKIFYPNRLNLIMAVIGGKAIGGVIFYKFKNRISLDYAGWDRKYAKICPNHFLYWEAIKKAKHQGYEILDFGRTSVSNLSLLYFKNGWGAKTIELPHFIYPSNAAEMINQIDQSWRYQFVSRLCKYAPVSFQNMIGKLCYRHIS